MTRKIICTLALSLVFTATAGAHVINDGHWHRVRAKVRATTASVCPLDGPDRTFTIVNAGVTGVTLGQIAAIQQATRDESFMLRAYYGTPCAWFGSGGTPIYLSNGYEALRGGASTYQLGGYHTPSGIYVQTGLTPYTNWVRAFTHEVMEDLVNPSGTLYLGTYFAEVCDPVENLTYEVDQLRVSDFALPSYYSRGAWPWDIAHGLTGSA